MSNKPYINLCGEIHRIREFIISEKYGKCNGFGLGNHAGHSGGLNNGVGIDSCVVSGSIAQQPRYGIRNIIFMPAELLLEGAHK